jgi:hypothetical protein
LHHIAIILKKGAWVPFLLRISNGTHLHPRNKTQRKKKKMREFNFMSRLGNDTHLLGEATTQKEKRGNWPLSKVDNGTHRNKKLKNK